MKRLLFGLFAFFLMVEVSAESFDDKGSSFEKTEEAVKEKAEKAREELKSDLEEMRAKSSGVLSKIKEKAKKAKQKAKSQASKVHEKISDKTSEIQEEASNFIEKTKDSFSEVLRVSRTMFTKDQKRDFCPVDPKREYAPTIEDPRVIEQDEEGMIPIIKKYSPVLYLFNERYYPVAAEDYFLNPTTQLVYAQSKDEKPTVVIPAGEITMQKIYENRTKYSGRWYYFDISGCTKYGSNPEKFSDEKGNLTTPIYVNWSKQGEKIYIAYVFVYAFNGEYPIAAPVADVKMFQDGAHEFDLEHIVLELDATSKKLENIFFAAHSRAEGVWLPADHQDIRYEGTHPVVHVAKNGHGSYPRAGTHVRILGFANDITSQDYKAHRWVPQIVLIYPDTDKRFDPAAVGWVYHSGVYGQRGVGSYTRFIGTNAQGKGMPYEKVQFCPNPQDPKDLSQWARYRLCVEKKRIKAKIPK